MYHQKYFEPNLADNPWQWLVSEHDNPVSGTLTIQQEAAIGRTVLERGKTLKYQFDRTNSGSFLFVVRGEIEVGEETLGERDAIGIARTSGFTIKATRDSEVLNIVVPMN